MATRRFNALAGAVACAALIGCATTRNGGDAQDLGEDQAAPEAPAEAGVNPDLAAEELSEESVAAPQTDGNANPAATVEITDLRYKSTVSGGTVIIETSAPATFRTREVASANQVIVEIANAKLPERFKRPYVSKEFRQDIASINAYQDPDSATARIVVQFRAAASATVRQEGKQLLLTYAPPGSGGNVLDPLADANAPGSYSVEGGGRGNQPMAGGGVDDMLGNSGRFYGKPISLEARDVPVREVINAIAEQSGTNIVLSDEVKDKRISLKLRQVPWDQALILIMKAQKLGYVRQGTVLRVASLESLRSEAEEAKRVIDSQRKAQPMKTKIVPVSYAKVDDIKKAVEPFLKAEGTNGQMTIDVRTSSVLITDIPENIDRVVNIIKSLDSAPLQVMIEGKVLEASEKFNRTFGINWGADGGTVSAGNYTVGASGPQFNNSLQNPTNTFGLSIGTFDLFGNLNASIGLAENQDLVRILSAPKVVTLNNEKATINQSVAIPQPQLAQTTGTGSGGSSGTTAPIVGIQYKSAKLELNVTPQITAESDIILDMDITREFFPTAAQNTQPQLESRYAKTKVLVHNGQTAVVGGIYQSDATNSEGGLPWIKDIPVFGYLFKSVQKQKNKNELLVFLTPRILNAEKAFQKEESL